jgi:hypothetical protein
VPRQLTPDARRDYERLDPPGRDLWLLPCDTLTVPFGPLPTTEGDWMAFTYRLEQEDGTPADPFVLHTAVPTWNVGTIPLGGQGAPRHRDAIRGRRAGVFR